MNCIFLCDYAALYGGNFIPSLLELEKALLDKGVHVIYVFPDEAKEMIWYQRLLNMGKTIETFQFRCDRKAFVKKVCGFVDRYDAKKLYSHFCSPLKIELVSFARKKTQVYIHLHSDFFMGKNSMKRNLLLFVFYRLLASRISFLSVSKEYVKYNPQKIKWIPNGLANRDDRMNHISREDRRKKLGVQDDTILIEVFGWSPYVKGVDVAVNAVKKYNECIENHKKVKLLIVCGIEVTSDKMKEFIAKQTMCSGNEEYVLYVEPEEDVFSFHEAADCLLSASRSEGFSYAILEMLSIGKKCIVSDIPGVSWSKVYSGVSTFISENIEDCCSAIQNFVKHTGAINIDDIEKVKSERNIQVWTNAVMKELGV